MQYKNNINSKEPIINNALQEVNQKYSYGPEQRSINIKPNIININSKPRTFNPYDNNEININRNNDIAKNESYNYNYLQGPDPNNEAQMNYLKNLLEKTKSEIDQLNNNINEESSKAFNIYK